MRLIKTGPYRPGQQKLEIIQKWGSKIPDYAVLSHTWSSDPEDEVVLADVQNGTARDRPAFPKLWNAIERARLDGYGWLWDDTCCIDKTSSVELSEAINSMYSYYENAQKCYAYLVDVTATGHDTEFKVSNWWLRGWTLQELLAPKCVEFYTSEWVPLGTKSDLRKEISRITGIDEDYLSHEKPVQYASIAKRMSWASCRATTREEDRAYCLIGLFDVNMAMLYGEGGKKAFLRLQEEVMRINEDQSLFAWVKADSAVETFYGHHGLLADSPKDFQHTASTIPHSEPDEYSPSSMTARGLHIKLPLMRKPDGTFVAALQCSAGQSDKASLAVYLKPQDIKHQYARVDCQKLASVARIGQAQEVYVRQHFPKEVSEKDVVEEVYQNHFFQFHGLQATTQSEELRGLGEYRLVAQVHGAANVMLSGETSNYPVAPRQPWSDVPLVYDIDNRAGALSVAVLVKRSNDGESFILMLGCMTEHQVGFDVVEGEALDTFEHVQKAFSPRGPNEIMELGFHNVRVTVEHRASAGRKVYFLNMEIEAIPQPVTVGEVLHDTVEMMAQPMFSPGQRMGKVALKQKLKKVWTTL